MFNNITQIFSIDDFWKFKTSIENVDVEKFYELHPTASKIYMRTKFGDLYFTFSEEEIYEMRQLLGDAELKLKLMENIERHYN